MFCIKRTYNKHGDCDYLNALDPEWITSCTGFRAPDLLQYADQAKAQAVVDGFAKAYAEKFPDAAHHKFAAVPFPPSN